MVLEPDLRPLLRRALRSTRASSEHVDVGSDGDDGGHWSGSFEQHPRGPRGEHTLEVRVGSVVGVDGLDVFVEFGPRFQGVWRLPNGVPVPNVGERRRFTLRGTEEGLWVLELPGVSPLDSWRAARVGSLVEARVIAPHPFGLELRVGDLHAFMPFSQLGLGRRVQARALVGHRMVCEVLSVEAHRQRIVLSRRLAAGRERERGLSKTDLVPGRIVSGRISRIVPYGVFVELGARLRGLIHVSDVAHERVHDLPERFQVGQSIDVLVLAVERGGRRIALGLKQLETDPLEVLEARLAEHPVLVARSRGRTPRGVWFDLPGGVQSLCARTELGVLDERSPELKSGAMLAVRLLRVDRSKRRVDVSLVHRDGRMLALDDALAHLPGGDEEESPRDARLAGLIGRALRAGGGYGASGDAAPRRS
jgi:predicted RNA-binding protein with RPS1 domain